MESKKKDKYLTRNWKEYNRSLVNRGSLTFWFEEGAMEKWYSVERTQKPGRPDVYSDSAIRCGLMIKAVFRTTLRALQGFIQSIFQLVGLPFICPHYSVFSRRAKDLQIPLRKLLTPGAKLNIIFDSTGVKVFGEGEWKVRKFGYCKRRTWRKIHVGMDADTGQIVVGAMSTGDTKDEVPMLHMMEALEGLPLGDVIGDGAYDTVDCSLSILGAVGFIVWLDLYKRLTGRKKRITFTSKVILSLTFSFLSAGTLLFFLVSDKATWITSFFQVMTASTTAGFNTVDIGGLPEGCIVLLVFLMVFGASPSGTGGGLKITTFAALAGLVKSTVSGNHTMSFWHREIPDKRLRLATATLAYYSFVMTLFVFFLVLSERKDFLPIVFEAASALGTVGLSMGITSDLTPVGKILITLLMLMGRVGILTFGIALAVHKKEERYLKDNELVF